MSSHQGPATLSSRLDELYEFERAPISSDRLHSGRYFAGLFSGEHVAATEFVIGAMFVMHGIEAGDLIKGLLLGNLLAVLSWAFICAPIAVRTRLTLYWYLRRIVGPGLTVVYNVVNAVLYCILAGAMIAVSASAVSLAFRIKHPGLRDVWPNSVGWVLVVLLVGGVVVMLAILGFKKLSQFAGVCAPWMFLVFIAGALATLPKLGEFRSFAELWDIAETRIWNGVAHPDKEKLGFWHVTFFAWFCNLAMHVGLSDMALFRYARKWTYGFYSAFGMYLGHYLAWICAGVMGAALAEGLNPGQMAHGAVGLAGAVAVVVAGWTTANPTMYRAGLALQIATPNWPRWKVTLAAGVITSIVACFPIFFMRLLEFVAIYGLTLMPIGAIVFAEHWLFPRLGLRQCWAEKRGVVVNVPALVTWLVVVLISFPFEQFTASVASPMHLLGVHLFFRWLPGWFISVTLYGLLCYVWPGTQAAGAGPGEAAAPPAGPAQPMPAGSEAEVSKAHPRTPMFWISGAMALLALGTCIYLPLKVFLGGSVPDVYDANMASYKARFLVATIVYFIAAIAWAGQREKTGPAT